MYQQLAGRLAAVESSAQAEKPAEKPKKKSGRPRTKDTPLELAIWKSLQDQPGDWYAIAETHRTTHDEVERVYNKFRGRKESDSEA